jgi:hypothetical protein
MQTAEDLRINLHRNKDPDDDLSPKAIARLLKEK